MSSSSPASRCRGVKQPQGQVPGIALAHNKTTMLQPPVSAALNVCRSKTRQILGVDLRRWTLLGIIVILLILLISLVARLRGAQPRALPQVQVQGGLLSLLWLSVRLLAMLQCLAEHLHQRSGSSIG